MYLIIKLSLNDHGVWIIFIIAWSFVLVRDQMFVFRNVYSHKVATFAICWLKFNSLRLLQKLDGIISCLLEGLLHILVVVGVALIALHSLFQTFSDSYLPGNVVIENSGFMHIACIPY